MATESPQSNGQMYMSASNMQAGNRKRKLLIGMVLLIAAIGAVVYLLLRDSERVDVDAPVSTITMDANGFTPATIKIKKGQEVAWTNNDQANAHEVTADQKDAPGLDSAGPLVNGDTYIYEFEKTGTVNFYDPLDPTKYKGTVIVE